MSIKGLTKNTNEVIKVHKKTFYIRTGILITFTNILTLTLFSSNTDPVCPPSKISQIKFFQLKQDRTLIRITPYNPMVINHLEEVSLYSKKDHSKLLNARVIDPTRITPTLKNKITNGQHEDSFHHFNNSEISPENNVPVIIEISKDDAYKLLKTNLKKIFILPRNSIDNISFSKKKTKRRKYEFKY